MVTVAHRSLDEPPGAFDRTSQGVVTATTINSLRLPAVTDPNRPPLRRRLAGKRAATAGVHRQETGQLVV